MVPPIMAWLSSLHLVLPTWVTTFPASTEVSLPGLRLIIGWLLLGRPPNGQLNTSEQVSDQDVWTVALPLGYTCLATYGGIRTHDPLFCDNPNHRLGRNWFDANKGMPSIKCSTAELYDPHGSQWDSNPRPLVSQTITEKLRLASNLNP